MKLSHDENLPKGEMIVNGKYEFFIVNARSDKLSGTVSWNNEVFINVDGLEPGAISEKEVFSPKSGVADLFGNGHKKAEATS